ncbi:MAG TPA: type II secretion system F family protein [Actinomycetaceae bacterium]|nr:type II secretion system F family protein [Actinomycetaceae bacterium]
MGVILGLMLGAGLLLVWLSFFPEQTGIHHPRADRLRDLLVQAGWPGASPAGFIALSIASGVIAAAVIALVTGAVTVGVAFGVIAGFVPTAVVRSRAAKRRTTFHELWPEAIEGVLSAVRAGMSLPEALGSLAERGPEPMREHFSAFAGDYAVTARFDESLDRLKERFADPMADRVAEALRITREVGGTDLGTTLRSLATMLRADLRTRGELRARQSWTVNAARLAVAAPWAVLAVLGTRTDSIGAFDSAAGVLILAGGASASVFAYWLMMRIGALPEDRRVLR